MRNPRKRETSDTLKNTIAKYAVRDNAYLLGEYYGQVRLEPVITTSYNSFHIEFKIGTRKLYILRNICKMLDSVEYGNMILTAKIWVLSMTVLLLPGCPFLD